MKISISIPRAAGGPPTVHVLGDDAVREFIGGWAPAVSALVQTSRPPRAGSVTKFTRENKETVMPFIVSRSHATYAAALLFVCREMREKPGLQGDVTISQIGGTAASALIEDAVISNVSIVGEITGVETVLQYRIEGGAFLFNTT